MAEEHQVESNNDLDFKVQINKEETKKKEKKSESTKQSKQDPEDHQAEQVDVKKANSEFTFQFFHIFFKALALALYHHHIIGSFFVLNTLVNSTFTFIFVVLLNAFDFWTVKNLTGR